MLVFLLIAVLVGAFGSALVMGRLPGAVPTPVRDTPYQPLPPGPVTSEEVAQLRFNVVLRGYRMDEVDEVLARLGRELDQARGVARDCPGSGDHLGQDTARTTSGPSCGGLPTVTGEIAAIKAEGRTGATAADGSPGELGGTGDSKKPFPGPDSAK